MSGSAPEQQSILYITYDGVLEPLGQSQVLQYLKGLAKEHRITLLSYEKPIDWADRRRRAEAQDRVRQAGIRWIALTYHKRPSVLGTFYDLAVGFMVCVVLALRQPVRIVHARSYVPSVLAVALKGLFGARFIFDMRGFWADEKVDGGSWRAGSLLYRIAKRFERVFLTRADVVVSLTHAGVKAMREFPYLREASARFEVIPTCADLDLFHATGTPARLRRSGGAGFTLCYLGSVGTRYLFDEVLECFKVLLEHDATARLLVLNRGQHDYVRERVRALGVPEGSIALRSADYEQVAGELCNVDAGIFFYRPAFSTLGTAPTKLAEFLGCGLPCLANAGVGDYASILAEKRVGAVLGSFTAKDRDAAVGQLVALARDPDTARRCIDTALQYFALQKGVERYARIYRELAAG